MYNAQSVRLLYQNSGIAVACRFVRVKSLISLKYL